MQAYRAQSIGKTDCQDFLGPDLRDSDSFFRNEMESDAEHGRDVLQTNGSATRGAFCRLGPAVPRKPQSEDNVASDVAG